MIDWILANLEKVIPVLVVLFWLFGNRKSEEDTSGSERPLSSPQPTHAPSSEPVDEESNLRRIQEEIRRRIEERQQQRTPPAVTTYEPPPLPVQPAAAPAQVSGTDRLDDANYGRIEDAAAAPDDMSDAGVYGDVPEAAPASAAATMEDRLRDLERYRVEVEQLTRNTVDASFRAAMIPAAPGLPSGARARGSLVALLRDPHGLREAIVLREVLGPPPGLR